MAMRYGIRYGKSQVANAGSILFLQAKDEGLSRLQVSELQRVPS